MFLQSWKIRQAFERGEESTTSSSIIAREEEDYAKISVHWNLTCREEAKQTAKKSSTLENLFAAAFLQQPVPPEDPGWLQLKGCGLQQEQIKTAPEPIKKEIKENDCKKESNRKISDKDCIPCRGAGRANLLVYLPCKVCNGTGLNSEYQMLKEEKEEQERIEREKLREAIRKEKEATESEQKSISEERQEELADMSSSENETMDEEVAWEEEKKRENECWEKQKRGEKGEDEEGVISEYVYWNICVKREKRVIPRPSFIPPLDLRALEGVEREDPGVILHRHRPEKK